MPHSAMDYDSLFKEFISDFFPEFIAFADLQLYQDIDWEKGYTFLEQELQNALRGKWRLSGKRKFSDKLVKVTLKSGELLHVLIHIEFQHKPERKFSRRMFVYRSLIDLRYDLADICAFAVYTGAPPSNAELSYAHQTYGSRVEYHYTNLIAARYDENELIHNAINPFALVMLAAKFAYQSRRDIALRKVYKRMLLILVMQYQWMRFDSEKILNFVNDFVNLPNDLGHEFRQAQLFLSFPNQQAMTTNRKTNSFTNFLAENGLTFAEYWERVQQNPEIQKGRLIFDELYQEYRRTGDKNLFTMEALLAEVRRRDELARQKELLAEQGMYEFLKEIIEEEKSVVLNQLNLEFEQRNIEFEQRNIEFEQRNIEFKQRNIEFKQRNIEFEQKLSNVVDVLFQKTGMSAEQIAETLEIEHPKVLEILQTLGRI
jgi:predicted XRE-type DNA-binding protein